jgi:hypothetical protein
MYETGGWSPTAMPRRETQHSHAYPRYDGDCRAEKASGRPCIVDERKVTEQATLAVAVEEPTD